MYTGYDKQSLNNLQTFSSIFRNSLSSCKMKSQSFDKSNNKLKAFFHVRKQMDTDLARYQK